MNKKAIFIGLIIAIAGAAYYVSEKVAKSPITVVRRDIDSYINSIWKYYLGIISFLINFTILYMDMLGNSKKWVKYNYHSKKNNHLLVNI